MCDTKKSRSIHNITQQLGVHLAAKGLNKPTTIAFQKLETNSQRVDFVYGLLEKFGLFARFVENNKSDELAVQLREAGNEKFKIKKNMEALELYTKSVAAAELNSENLGLAYANRSAVLCENGMYAECLVDIDRAFQNKYPDRLKEKLLARQEKAKKLKKYQKHEKYFQTTPVIRKSEKNPLIQCASDKIELKYTKELGRHVVAKTDLKIGEVLAVEKPFCCILIEQFQNHCHECLKLCYNLIPCEKCTHVLYCSESCKTTAYNYYHKYECPIVETVKDLDLDQLKLLPMKIAMLVRSEYNEIASYIIKENEVYRSDRYKEIHFLTPNTKSRTVSDLIERSVVAAVIYEMIKNHTSFFNEPCVQNMEDIFKELVLLHLQTGACNFHEIAELTQKIYGYELDQIGAGAYSFFSMINHSCAPNVDRHDYGTENVLRPSQNIKKGEQLFDNYGYHYAVMPKKQRKAKLIKQYFFDCKCEPCENDWPLYKHLPNVQGGLLELPQKWIKLADGDLKVAIELLPKIIQKMEKYERNIPNKPFNDLQESLKQCYAIFGNVRRQ